MYKTRESLQHHIKLIHLEKICNHCGIKFATGNIKGFFCLVIAASNFFLVPRTCGRVGFARGATGRLGLARTVWVSMLYGGSLTECYFILLDESFSKTIVEMAGG